MTPTSENPCPGWRKESCLYPYARVCLIRELEMQTFFDNLMWLGLEKSSGEAYPPEPEAPERPREAALEMEAREAVDEINESSLIVLTTFSSNG